MGSPSQSTGRCVGRRWDPRSGPLLQPLPAFLPLLAGAQERRAGQPGAPRAALAQTDCSRLPPVRSSGLWVHPAHPAPPALTEMASLVHVSMMGCSRLSNSFMSSWVSSRSFCICCSTAWAKAAVTCSWEARWDRNCPSVSHPWHQEVCPSPAAQELHLGRSWPWPAEQVGNRAS